jgi:hypothetical protein
MGYLGYALMECVSAKEFWDRLSPENTIIPPPARFIYRGQKDAMWGLTPSVLRDGSRIINGMLSGGQIGFDLQVYGELRLLEEFAKNCDSIGLRLPNDSIEFRQNILNNEKLDDYYLGRKPWPGSDLIDFMALAQHHRVPTRLLDWTRRSYVAAYFAAADALRNNHDGNMAVWILNTMGLAGLYPKIQLIDAPGSTSANLAAQSGLFTLVPEKGYRGQALKNRNLEEEFYTEAGPRLWKLTLPAKLAGDVLELCALYSISAATLFPGYDGAAIAVQDSIAQWQRPRS